jgi:hypothetical protein
MSADIDYPRRLEQSGLAGAAAWSNTPWAHRPVDAEGFRHRSSRRPAGARHPRRSEGEAHRDRESGARALRTRRRCGAAPRKLYDRVKSKFVLGENISQAQFAQSGNAEVGIVALSLALGQALKDSRTYVEIPPTSIRRSSRPRSSSRSRRAGVSRGIRRRVEAAGDRHSPPVVRLRDKSDRDALAARGGTPSPLECRWSCAAGC